VTIFWNRILGSASEFLSRLRIQAWYRDEWIWMLGRMVREATDLLRVTSSIYRNSGPSSLRLTCKFFSKRTQLKAMVFQTPGSGVLLTGLPYTPNLFQ
jgi:hypothetical protein